MLLFIQYKKETNSLYISNGLFLTREFDYQPPPVHNHKTLPVPPTKILNIFLHTVAFLCNYSTSSVFGFMLLSKRLHAL